MEILILLLVSPAIFAQRYRKHVNPNDEPFLPIHPAYPYSPKLTKRGSDKEIVTLLKPELYAPRTDARDSYTASYAGSPKDSYFSGYGSYPRSSVAPYSPYSSYYGNGLYGAYMNPHMGNLYVGSPYTSGPHGSSSYPGYYQQSPYFYPEYYNQPFPYSFPPPDHSGPPGPPGPPWNENSNSNRDYLSSKYEKSKFAKPKGKENSSSSSNGVSGGLTHPNGSGNQYVDGNNLISQSYKDLMVQSSPYKSSNSYNQLEQIADLHLKNLPLPPPTYKVISVGGQPVGPDYPLPSSYARAQLLEQAAAVQNLAKSMGNAFPHQTTDSQGSKGISSYLPYHSTVGGQGLLEKPNQEGQYYSEVSNAPGKSAEAHIYGSDDRDLPDKEANNQFLAPNQDPSSKLADVQIYGDRQHSKNQDNAQMEYAIGQVDKSLEAFAQSPASPPKAPSKYQSLPYAQKPGTRVTFERSQGTYIPPVKIARPGLEEADPSSVQSYDQLPLSQSDSFRSKQNYHSNQMQSPILYQNQNLGHATPQAYSYHEVIAHPLAQGSQQQHKTNLEDVNFGAKQGNRG